MSSDTPLPPEASTSREPLADEVFGACEVEVFGSRRLSAVLHPASLSFALAGLLLTTFAASALYRTQKESLAREFNSNLESVHRALDLRLSDTEQHLGTVRAYLAAAGGPETLVGNAKWDGFLAALETSERLPGVRGAGFAAVVPAGRVREFEDEVRAAGHEGYRIVSNGEHSLYVPVVRYELVRTGGSPSEQGDASGYDLLSERGVGPTLAWARDMGAAAVSPVDDWGRDFGAGSRGAFLMCLPVYSGEDRPSNVAARRARIEGYVFCVVEVGEFLASVVEGANGDIGLRFTDTSSETGAGTIFASAESSISADFRSQLDIHLGGHYWTIEAFSLAAFEDWVSRLSTLFAALSGVAVTLFGMMVLADSKSKQERAAKAAREANSQLQRSEAEVRQLNSELEEKVAARTASLEAALEDLKSFSYSLSHDLRAPVRHVRLLADLLDEEHGRELPPGAGDYFRRMREAADRMHDLIEGILLLASCGKGAIRPRRIDLTAMASQIVEEQLARVAGRVIHVKIQEGMKPVGDPTVLRTALQNLIENAFKFTSEAEVAEISVGLAEADGIAEIHVSDNGVGFDMDQVENIFQPFKQLHRANGREGIGLGLATVRKMVRRHGGEISVESAIGGGATFRFTLGRPAGDRPARADSADCAASRAATATKAEAEAEAPLTLAR